MRVRTTTALLAFLFVPALAAAAPSVSAPRFDPRQAPALPSYVQRVEPSLVGLYVKADPERPSSARLGAQRFGTGVVFDARGYAVTVSYVVLDALRIDAKLRDGRAVSARLVGLDLDTGLAVKDELISAGRVLSRRPRPWLGLYTNASAGRVVVEGFNESGPARTAGFRMGDQIVGVNGVRVGSQEEFYEALWRRQAGDTIEVSVRRADRVRVIPVRSIPRCGRSSPTRRRAR